MDKVRIRNRVQIPLKDLKNTAEFIAFYGLPSDKEHIALCFQTPDKDKYSVPLVRVHSECMTGDVFHSLRCDCGEQLEEALKYLDNQGGILLYLRQEGRGIGLYNKIDAYQLQSEGLDTYQANLELGFSQDEREFTTAALMLKALEVDKIRLLSNNPQKLYELEQNSIRVLESIGTGIYQTPYNQAYLRAKKEQTYHLINL